MILFPWTKLRSNFCLKVLFLGNEGVVCLSAYNKTTGDLREQNPTKALTSKLL